MNTFSDDGCGNGNGNDMMPASCVNWWEARSDDVAAQKW